MRLPFRRKSKLPSVLPAHLAVIMDGHRPLGVAPRPAAQRGS